MIFLKYIKKNGFILQRSLFYYYSKTPEESQYAFLQYLCTYIPLPSSI